MSRYIDADMLEKDGWNIQRIRQVSSIEMVYETKKPTEFPAADVEKVQHGKWESVQYGCVCSVCGKRKEQFSDNFCANCGAKMDGHFEEPAINPCRGCEDYDGRGGCISKGGCGAKMDEVEE